MADLRWKTLDPLSIGMDSYQRELGLDLVVDLVEGAAEVSEFLACLIGDEKLRHPVPIDRLGGLRRHLHHLLRSVPAHPRWIDQGLEGSSQNQTQPSALNKIDKN